MAFEKQLKDIDEKLTVVLAGVTSHDTDLTNQAEIANLKDYLRDLCLAISILARSFRDAVNTYSATNAWLDELEDAARKGADNLPKE